MSKILWLDTETTGLDPVKQDIVQLAGIITQDGKELERFNLFCQPFDYTTIQQEALDVQKRTVEQLKTYPIPQKTFQDFLGIIRRHVNQYDKKDKFHIAGQHVQFDIDFLKQFFIKNGDTYFGAWFNYYSVDLFALASILKAGGYIETESLKLAALCQYCGVTLVNAHDAMADIEATRECFRLLTKQHLRKQGALLCNI